MTALKVNQIGPLELKQRIDAGEALELIKCREPYEKEIADMGGKLIPLKTILIVSAKFRVTSQSSFTVEVVAGALRPLKSCRVSMDSPI